MLKALAGRIAVVRRTVHSGKRGARRRLKLLYSSARIFRTHMSDDRGLRRPSLLEASDLDQDPKELARILGVTYRHLALGDSANDVGRERGGGWTQLISRIVADDLAKVCGDGLDVASGREPLGFS
jgi:hypothetical protein